MGLYEELLIENWVNASKSQKDEYVFEVEKILGQDFKFLDIKKADWISAIDIANYLHIPSNTTWCLIPGGNYLMGFSKDEENASRKIMDPPPLTIEEMRPVHQESVDPFLMMQYPIGIDFVQKYISLKNEEFRPVFEVKGNYKPIYLLWEEVIQILENFGFSLPSEVQWEYACRAGTQTLFFFGNDIPNKKELEKLVSPKMVKPNPFNLYGLFLGEWCKDRFTSSYGGSILGDDIYTIRGGASVFWPWQDAGEWAFCLSSMRMPSSDLMSGFCGARLIFNIF